MHMEKNITLQNFLFLGGKTVSSKLFVFFKKNYRIFFRWVVFFLFCVEFDFEKHNFSGLYCLYQFI